MLLKAAYFMIVGTTKNGIVVVALFVAGSGPTMTKLRFTLWWSVKPPFQVLSTAAGFRALTILSVSAWYGALTGYLSSIGRAPFRSAWSADAEKADNAATDVASKANDAIRVFIPEFPLYGF